jgi:two-component system sensor histidine kinase PhoQ
MTPGGYSMRARLLLGAALVLLAFVAAAGLAVQKAHADSVRASHFARLQGTVYLLLARMELDDQGTLQMPAEVAEPRLAVPASGLYATIHNALRDEQWRSASSVAVDLPQRPQKVARGEWVQDVAQAGDRQFHALHYAVNWAAGRRQAPLVLSVFEDKAGFDREVAIFSRTLWTWLGGAAVLLLIAQVVLFEWALAPLRRVAAEIRRVENGEQPRIEGRYPSEITGLTDNLNTLILQQAVRQGRYKEALSFLAHSLKTPLAVLRNALHEPAQLKTAVEQQVARMDAIVQHQLGRAAAGGATGFAPRLPVAPVAHRVRDALMKVYAEKRVVIDVDCPADLAWRIEEGDLFEMLGNLMDNAAKWAKQRVAVRARIEEGSLSLAVEDDGPGFSDTTSVLGMHVRGDERVPGHGVGLAVVNDLVAGYQGRLVLDRGPLGGGRVRITLPAYFAAATTMGSSSVSRGTS